MEDIRSFMDWAEEVCQFNLLFPFHINHDQIQGRLFFDEHSTQFHVHGFEGVLRTITLEPFAFSLTEEDRQCYSAQELEFIDKLQAYCKLKCDIV